MLVVSMCTLNYFEICERFYKTRLNEFYSLAFRRNAIQRWKHCKKTWTIGSNTITMAEPIRGKGVVDACQWKRCLMVNRFGLRKVQLQSKLIGTGQNG